SRAQSPALTVTNGLVLHLESTTGVSATEGLVTGWSDTSGSGNHLVPASSSNAEPLFVEAGTPSGLPALVFDGTADVLERVHASQALVGLPIGNGDRTMFVVAKYNSTTWWGGVAYGAPLQNQAFGLGVKHPSGELFLQGFGGGNDLVSTTPGLGAGWL